MSVWPVATHTRTPEGSGIIAHHDLAPWNLVIGPARWAFIDWDTAAPGSRLWDLAYALHGFVPLSANPRYQRGDPTHRRHARCRDGAQRRSRPPPPQHVDASTTREVPGQLRHESDVAELRGRQHRADIGRGHRMAMLEQFVETAQSLDPLQSMPSADIAETIRGLVEKVAGGEKLEAVGVGFPGIIRNGVVEGACGVGGGTSQQDEDVAKAAVAKL